MRQTLPNFLALFSSECVRPERVGAELVVEEEKRNERKASVSSRAVPHGSDHRRHGRTGKGKD